MLPQAYELPAAIVLVLAGAITCFAGYRLFRFVLAIWGFILGVGIGSSMMGADNAVAMIVAGLVGGLLGALALVFAYFVGVALVGAGLGALVAHLTWSQLAVADPPAAAIIGASIVGAVGAMLLQRYVIVVGTAFGGAWMVIVGAVAVAGSAPGRGVVRATAAPDVWIMYPLTPAPGQPWVIVAWVGLGLIGTAIQLAYAGKKR
jgi:hypothetical protein